MAAAPEQLPASSTDAPWVVRDASLTTGVVVVEEAAQLLSARHGLLPEQAFAVLQGLAESQGRGLHEFAGAVVRSGGRLDG